VVLHRVANNANLRANWPCFRGALRTIESFVALFAAARFRIRGCAFKAAPSARRYRR
jgi:hypothetical protein